MEKLIILFKKAPKGLKERFILILAVLLLSNIGVWIAAIILSSKVPVLFGLVALAYGLGLRHGVDADHIAAIDNTTRKLMHEGKRPVAVGFFFSLGHSTVVLLLSLLLAFSAAFVTNNLPAFKETGSIVGTLFSSGFLLIIGIINVVVLFDIFKLWRKVMKGETYHEAEIHEHLHNRGLLARIFRPFLKTVTKSFHMYFIGFLFGLGFDTASEVALLSISATSGASGMPFWDVLLLPLAFTAAMCLVDTLDGILMLGAYGWAQINPMRKLFYNMNITFISVVIAIFIGGIEALQVFIVQLNLHGAIFDEVSNLNFGNLGYFIIGIFLASWLVSIGIYKLKRYDLIESRFNKR